MLRKEKGEEPGEKGEELGEKGEELGEKGEEPGEKGEEPGEMTMDENPLHMLWTELPSMSGRPVYFNRYTGRCVLFSTVWRDGLD